MMKTLSYLLLAGCIALTAGCGETPDAELNKMAAEFNAACPMMVDSETRLDSATARPGEFRYNYTLINLQVSQIDTAAFNEVMRPLLIEGAKSNAALAYFRTHKVALLYHYRDMNGAFVQSIFLEPETFSY